MREPQDERSLVSSIRFLRRKDMACTSTHPCTSPCALDKVMLKYVSVPCLFPNSEVIVEGRRNFYPAALKRQRDLEWPTWGKSTQTCSNVDGWKWELRSGREISGSVPGGVLYLWEWVSKRGTTFIKGDMMITWLVYMKSVFNSFLESTVFCLLKSVSRVNS